MAVYLDNKILDVSSDNLDSVLQEVALHLAGLGRVLVEVKLNGRALVGDELDQREKEPLGDAELRLISTDPHDLAVSTLQHTHSRLDDAGHAQSQAADLLQQDQTEAAMDQVGEAIQAWLQVQQAVQQSAGLIGINLDEKTIDGEPITQLIQNLVDQLKQLREVITASDLVGLADALAYEWPETIGQWHRLVEELIGWIQQTRATQASGG